MGLIAKVKSFVRAVRNNAKLSDVQANARGGAALTCEHFSSSGDDAFPLDIDFCLLVPTARTGSCAVAGYSDITSEPKSQAGEKRIYSRDSSGGVKSEVWLKNSGEIVIDNFAGKVTLKPSGEIDLSNSSGFINLSDSGTVTINSALTIDPSGNLTTTGTITGSEVNESTSGIDLASHVHGGVDTGSGSTSPPTP